MNAERLPLERILVPTDLGKGAERAVARGARVALLMVRRPVRRKYTSLLVALDRPPAPATMRAVDAALRLLPQDPRAVALHATGDELSASAMGAPGVAPATIDAWRARLRNVNYAPGWRSTTETSVGICRSAPRSLFAPCCARQGSIRSTW